MSSDDKKARVEFPQTLIQVFQRLQEEPVRGNESIDETSYWMARVESAVIPPFVDVDIGGACEPGVQDEDAAIGGAALQALLQAGIVMQAESFPEPVHQVFLSMVGVIATHCTTLGFCQRLTSSRVV